MNVLSLFDGMSCGQIALNRSGIYYENYFSSEINENAIKITQFNYPGTHQIGDVRHVKASRLPKIDLLIGGSPCQSFSIAGTGNGFDGESGLFWEFLRVLKEVKPTYFLLENVKMKKEWEHVITNKIGVEPILINSALVSAQERKRLYWTNIPSVGVPNDKGVLFKDIVNSDHPFKPLTSWFFKEWGGRKKIDTLRTVNHDKSFCLTTNRSHSKNYYLNSDRTMARMLERDEAEALQTVPKGYTSCVSKTAAHHALGNGWTVDVISHIFNYLPLK